MHLAQKIDLCSGTHVYMPDTLANIVRTRTYSSFRRVSPNNLIPLLQRYDCIRISQGITDNTLSISNSPTLLEKRPAATRYKKHVEMIKKSWMDVALPPLSSGQYLYVGIQEWSLLLINEVTD